ncbi:MAG TPA: shikimate kinase [Myxococcaceae bacterium]|nr:shikimate kinase [Myxococcaceae bacterium]
MPKKNGARSNAQLAGNRARAHRPLLVQLGKTVRKLRLHRSLTLKRLAQRSGLSARFLSDLEAGRANLSVVSLAAVGDALGESPARLLEGAQTSNGSPGVISLLGLRGAGKTTVGKLLAEKLRLPFFELDRLIESEAGVGLAEIFAIHGEDYYRRLEISVLKRFLAEHEQAVLATGGSVVTSPDAYRLLSEHTQTVWLKATPEEHWERVVGQGDFRPMQNRPHAMTELRRRLKEREPLYAKANLTCSTSGRSVSSVVGDLAARLHA